MAMNCKPSFDIRLIFCMLLLVLLLSIIIFCAVITFTPSHVKFRITEASLTKFNLTSNNTIYYKLEANITSRNPNKNVIVHYQSITAIAWYKDNEFASVNMTSFDQGHKNTTFLNVVFEGKGVIKLKPKQLAEYNEETRLGIYNDLAIDLDFRITYKFGSYKTDRFNPPIVQCRRLNLSLISNGNSSPPSFHDTKCTTGAFFGNR